MRTEGRAFESAVASYPGQLWPIATEESDAVTGFVSELCEAIHTSVS